MSGILGTGLIMLALAGPADEPALAQASQPADSVVSTPVVSEPRERKVFLGGTVGMTFGDYTRFTIQPLVGYQFTPKLSGGVKFIYEYIKDERYAEEITASNYGGSVFGRLRPIRQAYAHVEFAWIEYELQTFSGASDRVGVPFLYVGAGAIQQISPRTSAYVEVLFDVLRDDNSPYDEWEPFVSVGVMTGI